MAEPYDFPRLGLEAVVTSAPTDVVAAQALWDDIRALLLQEAPDRVRFVQRLQGVLLFWLMAMAEVHEGDPQSVLSELAAALEWSGLEMSMDDWEDLLEPVPPSERPH